MDEQELYDRRCCISNFLSISFEKVRASSVSSSQCDIHIRRPDGSSFRYGYFSDWMFWRENPVQRMLSIYGMYASEGPVDVFQEPQYDMTIQFSGRGSDISYVNDTRTADEGNIKPWDDRAKYDLWEYALKCVAVATGEVREKMVNKIMNIDKFDNLNEISDYFKGLLNEAMIEVPETKEN